MQKTEELSAQDEAEKAKDEEGKTKDEVSKESKNEQSEHKSGTSTTLPNLRSKGESSQTVSTPSKKDETPKKKTKLELFEEEQRLEKEKSIEKLSNTLIERLSILTESVYDGACKESFQKKFVEEANLLKMESFGVDILHTIGAIYYEKASIFLASQNLFGFGGVFHSMKAKGGVFMDTLRTVSAAIDAQNTMKELEKMKEANETDVDGTPKPTVDDLAKQEQLLMGKVLSAAWHGSRYEITSTLRSVCDKVLEDKTVPTATLVRRGEALKLLGEVFLNVYRTKAEQEEAQIFEELVAEATKKKRK